MRRRSRRFDFRSLWLLLSLIPGPLGYAAQQRVLFPPSATDPAITQFNNNHYAVIDPALPQKGRLVVFLPGTGGVPAVYTAFIENTATLGFHALGLMYPNPESINELCTKNDPSNPDCARAARLEVIDGTNRVPFVAVDRTNSIENRLLKALQYLQATYPARGFGQFFSGNTILWEKLIVAGHSQGGGHAALLAKSRVVDRCLMFAWIDWWSFGRRPYDWLGSASLTPVSRWFAFAHERDESIDLPKMQASVAALDVDRYGGMVRAESASSWNFGGTHFLATDLEPARGASGRYHGTPVTDLDTPRLPDGTTPVLKPVWDYMLLHETPPIALNTIGSELQITFSPGVLEFSETLRSWQPVADAESPLVLPRGGLVERRFYRLVPAAK